MPNYLDPKIDFVFKKIFGDHDKLLMSFLNEVLPLEDDQKITSLQYLNPEQIPIDAQIKSRAIVDVKCTDQRGRTFIVEMQMIWRPSFEPQLVFGAAQAYMQQKTTEMDYSDLHAVYALAIINETFVNTVDDWYHHLGLYSLTHPQQVKFNALHFVLVEIPKFKVETFAHKKLMVLWLRFLKEVEAVAEELKQEPLLNEALHIAEAAAYSPAELVGYQKTIDLIAREACALKDAEAKGKAEGLAEGELQAKRAIACELLDVLDDAQIAAKTKLPLEAVIALRRESATKK